MKVEILVSAMNLNDFSIVERMNCNTDVLIINQTDYNGYAEKKYPFGTARMISTTQRGLSRSRNMALMHANGDICLLCDDYEVLDESYHEKILSAFERYPSADIISFGFVNENTRGIKTKKNADGKSKRWKTYSSVSLAFKLGEILRHGVWFNTSLGTGSGIVSSGEESVWQIEAQAKGLRRYCSSSIIAYLKQESSSWYEGKNEKYYYDRGAILSLTHPLMKNIFMYYIILRTSSDATIRILERIKYMKAGMKYFKKYVWGYDSYKQYLDNRKLS